MDTNEFDERNFAKSRAVCEKMAKALHNERIRETWRLYKDELIELLDECGSVENIRKRLMPEGMEWPRYESGELVNIEDDVIGSDYGEHLEVSSIEFHVNGFTIHDINGFSKWYESDDRFEHPAPAVGADGLFIKNGEMVWHKSGLASGVVSSIDYDSLMRTVRYISSDGTEFRDAAKDLTHTKPEPPDSWEQLESDCTISERIYYARHIGHDVGLMDDAEIHEAVSRDLILRAKALAEKEEAR